MTLFIEQSLLQNLGLGDLRAERRAAVGRHQDRGRRLHARPVQPAALQGSTPSQAFQVKCDTTTTTPDDQANGIVNIVVAFAPLKPAEFVVIKIAQLAGQTQSIGDAAR